MTRVNHNFPITAEEFKAFLAILFTSGNAPLPRRRMYWENSADVRNEAISNCMTLNRFEEIMCFMHVADNNNLQPGDKVCVL